MTTPEHSITSLPERPTLLPGSIIMRLEDTVIVRRREHSTVLRGRSAALVHQLLTVMDGRLTLPEIAEATNIDYEQIRQIVARLCAAGVLTDQTATVPPDSPYIGSALLLDTKGTGLHAHLALREACVAVIGPQALGAEVMQQLSAHGVGHVLWADTAEATVQVEPRPDLFIHLVRGPDYQALGLSNTVALQTRVPWLAAWFEHTTLIVSHVMIPGENACFECLLRRSRGHYTQFESDLAFEHWLRAGNVTEHPALQTTTRSSDMLLAGMATLRAVSFTVGHRPRPPLPRLIEFSLTTLQSREHPVLRLPLCPVCGTRMARQQGVPFALRAPRAAIEEVPA